MGWGHQFRSESKRCWIVPVSCIFSLVLNVSLSPSNPTPLFPFSPFTQTGLWKHTRSHTRTHYYMLSLLAEVAVSAAHTSDPMLIIGCDTWTEIFFKAVTCPRIETKQHLTRCLVWASLTLWIFLSAACIGYTVTFTSNVQSCFCLSAQLRII